MHGPRRDGFFCEEGEEGKGEGEGERERWRFDEKGLIGWDGVSFSTPHPLLSVFLIYLRLSPSTKCVDI